jgi:hypothetical protein
MLKQPGNVSGLRVAAIARTIRNSGDDGGGDDGGDGDAAATNDDDGDARQLSAAEADFGQPLHRQMPAHASRPGWTREGHRMILF